MEHSPTWPYSDLRLRSPHCPVCGDPAHLMVGSNVHPVGWCINEECQSITWDPSKSAIEVLWPVFTGEERMRPWQELGAELHRRQAGADHD